MKVNTTRDYSAKELEDDVPSIAYEMVDVPNYKFPEGEIGFAALGI